MTIAIDATRTNAVMVQRNLLKMVNVIEVQDVTHAPAVFRDLALIKVHAESQARFEIMQLINVYRAKVVDICTDSMIIEVTGPEAKINSLVDMLKPYGIIEMVRTGLVAMVRGSGRRSDVPSDLGRADGYEDDEEEVETFIRTLGM
jgi:acetolactate synthase-1/3 small subunit